ncbi:MAG: Holliday junction branch migration protein RuvA [Pseudomonadota bacterium]
MITTLTGYLVSKHPLEAVIDIHGIAFEILISARTYEQLPNINEVCKIFTHLIWREDQQYLVGFHNEEDRAWFRRLIKITGIGAKVGLAILSTLTPMQIREAIESDDSTRLTRVPGVGKKTAERIVLELGDARTRQWMLRFSSTDSTDTSSDIHSLPHASTLEDLRDALSALGYNNTEIEKALKFLPKEGALDALLRQALQHLSGHRP